MFGSKLILVICLTSTCPLQLSELYFMFKTTLVNVVVKELGVCSLMLGLASQSGGSGNPSLESTVFIEFLCSYRYGEPSINPAPLIPGGFVSSCCSFQVGGNSKNG